MHFIQSNIAMLHYTSPVSTCSFGIQMVPSPSVTASSDWRPRAPLNIATGLHLHNEAINHPARNIWDYSGMASQGGSPTLLHSSSPASTCLHLCCSDREGTAAHRQQSQCGPLQVSTTNPNATYMTHTHGQGGSSLLGLSSAFSSLPVICQAPHVACNPSIPTMSSSHPQCSPVGSVFSHTSLSINTNLDPTHNLTRSQTPIHSSITPSGQPQYHTVFSSLSPSGVYTSLGTLHSASQHSLISGSRQSNPEGSSPIHYSQDFGPLLGQVLSSDSVSTPTPTEVQPPLLNIGVQSPHWWHQYFWILV